MNEKTPKFSDQYDPKMEEVHWIKENEEEDVLEKKLMPSVVNEIDSKIVKEGINEEGVKIMAESIMKAGFSGNEAELRKEAISAWRDELIDSELEKQKQKK